MVSSKIHAQLRIGRITAKWSGFEPSFDIDNLRIDAADGTPGLAVPHASATVAWRSLLGPIPLLSNLTVDGPDVVISRAADGTFSVAGVPIQAKHTGNDAFMTWLLRQQAIVLRDGTLRWHDGERDAPELALKRIKLAILNDGTHHRLALQAPPDGDLLHGPLDFRADFTHAALQRARPAGELDGPVVSVDRSCRSAHALAVREDAVRDLRRTFRQPHLDRLRERQAANQRAAT
jgi:uncharacterized protein YhdP